MGRKRLLSDRELERIKECKKNKINVLIPRLIIEGKRGYMLLKPNRDLPEPLSPSHWNSQGKTYSESGIRSLYEAQQSLNMRLYFQPPSLEKRFSQPSEVTQSRAI